MELNTVERAIRTETDSRIKKGVGKLGWFMSKTYTATSPPREGEPAGIQTESMNERINDLMNERTNE